jgi:hypothetical protein
MAETAAAPAAPYGAPPSPASAEGGKADASAPKPNGSTGPETPKPEAPPAPRRFKLKVNGSEREVDEPQYHTYAQKGLAADAAWQERAKLQTERAEFERRLKEDPIGLLRESGHDVDELTARYVLEQAKAEQETPEQRRIREYEEKLQAYEAEKEERAQAERAEQTRVATEQARAEYGEKFSAALEKAGIPRGPQAAWALSRMAILEQQNLDQGLEMSADQLAAVVSESIGGDVGTYFGTLEDEALLARAGPELTTRFTRAVVARYKRQQAEAAGGGKAAPPPTPKPTPPRDDTGKFSRADAEYERMLRG